MVRQAHLRALVLDRESDKTREASVVRGIESRHLLDVNQHWRPEFDRRAADFARAAVERTDEDRNWDWHQKSGRRREVSDLRFVRVGDRRNDGRTDGRLR